MEILKKLIQINSVSGNEADIQNFIFEYLKNLGFKPVYTGQNIVLEIKGQKPEMCLVLNAHTDTVDAGEVSKWEKGPLEAYSAGGKVYGLGASDNKASVALLLEIASMFRAVKPQISLVIVFSVNEEVDGSGTKEVVATQSKIWHKKYKNISAIVFEPTNSDYFCVGHKGNIFLKIETSGLSGHGSVPIANKDHAVLKMFLAIQKIEKISNVFKEKYSDTFLGQPTFGLATSISAGNSNTPNKFPDKCVATLDIRTTPKCHSIVFSEVNKALKGLATVSFAIDPVGYALTSKREDLVAELSEIGLKLKKFTGASDMPFFTEVGIPTVIFGPGNPEAMHKPNEYCSAGNITKGIKVLAKLINSYN